MDKAAERVTAATASDGNEGSSAANVGIEAQIRAAVDNLRNTKDTAEYDPKKFDMSVKNPNGGEEIAHRSPQEIMDEIAALDAESAEVLENIRQLLKTEKTDA